MSASLPSLEELAPDLLGTSRARRWLALGRPFACVAAYAACAYTGLWPVALVALFGVFATVVSAMHDAVHGVLGLRRRGTDWALFGLGALLLVSGHAYRETHQQHHRVFPGPDDPEGEAARRTPLRALADGPLHVARIWLWAFRRARRPARRAWLLTEAAVPLVALAAGAALARWSPALLAYVVLVTVGGWLYPLVTVNLPHHDYGDEPLTQARTLRGRLVPALLLEQTYHLEHHLYPRVPSHNLPRLARRLDPFLRAAGVEPRRVP